MASKQEIKDLLNCTVLIDQLNNSTEKTIFNTNMKSYVINTTVDVYFLHEVKNCVYQ